MSVVHRKDLPKWYTIYENIPYGYRPCLSFLETVLSIFTFHVETLNIHTHLWPGLYFLFKLFDIIRDDYFLYSSFACKLCIVVGYGGAACMGLFSSFAHAFFIIDESWNTIVWKLDFTGIIAINSAHLLYDTFILFNGILLDRTFLDIAISLEGIFALFCVYRIWYGTTEIRRYWGFVYPIITSIPLTVPIYIYTHTVKSSKLLMDLTFSSLNCTFFILIAGGIFFKGRFPERFWNPYQIFSYLNSHMFHHIFIVMSIIAAFKGLPYLSALESNLIYR
jgi:adiponectin receptor